VVRAVCGQDHVPLFMPVGGIDSTSIDLGACGYGRLGWNGLSNPPGGRRTFFRKVRCVARWHYISRERPYSRDKETNDYSRNIRFARAISRSFSIVQFYCHRDSQSVQTAISCGQWDRMRHVLAATFIYRSSPIEWSVNPQYAYVGCFVPLLVSLLKPMDPRPTAFGQRATKNYAGGW